MIKYNVQDNEIENDNNYNQYRISPPLQFRYDKSNDCTYTFNIKELATKYHDRNINSTINDIHDNDNDNDNDHDNDNDDNDCFNDYDDVEDNPRKKLFKQMFCLPLN